MILCGFIPIIGIVQSSGYRPLSRHRNNGCYYTEIDDNELRDICGAVTRQQKEQTEEQLKIKLSGEIFPTDIVPIITNTNQYQPMKWGFTGFDKRPLINARSETALTKPTFQEPMQKRRCLIPASGWYEWQKDKNIKIKHQIYIPGQPIYMAGCYRIEGSETIPRFVILTRPAADDIRHIHDRMPVVIPKTLTTDWLNSSPTAMEKAFTDFKFHAV